MTHPKLRTAIYARVSTLDQDPAMQLQTWPRRPLHLCGLTPTDPDLSCTSLPGMIRVNISRTSAGRHADSSRRHHLKQP
jgi:hypothetical protein